MTKRVAFLPHCRQHHHCFFWNQTSHPLVFSPPLYEWFDEFSGRETSSSSTVAPLSSCRAGSESSVASDPDFTGESDPGSSLGGSTCAAASDSCLKLFRRVSAASFSPLAHFIACSNVTFPLSLLGLACAPPKSAEARSSSSDIQNSVLSRTVRRVHVYHQPRPSTATAWHWILGPRGPRVADLFWSVHFCIKS